MPTLTQLEDVLRRSTEQTEDLLTQLITLHRRLAIAKIQPDNQKQYQQITLLLEAVIQSEDIIKVIYFRYHNQSIVIKE